MRAARGERFRHVRVWLNGKRVRTNDWVAGERTPSSRWPRGRRVFRALFGADDGLRFGRNHLRITAWSEHGIYDSVTRTVRIGRKAPLVGAGKGRTLRVKRKVRLDGRATKHRRGARVTYRWRIVAKPRGSKARLKGAGTARPTLVPDVRGSYRIRLVAEHMPVRGKRRGGRASASAAGATAMDEVTVQAKPAIPPLGTPIQTINEKGAIELLGREYAAEAGAWAQVLALDRETLAVRRHLSVGQAANLDKGDVEELWYLLDGFDERTLLVVSGGNRQANLPSGREEEFVGRLIEALDSVGGMAGGMGNMWKPTVQRAVSEGRWSLIGVPGSRGIATHNLIGAIYGMRPSEGWAPGAISGYLQEGKSGDYYFATANRTTINTNVAGSPAGVNRIQVGERIFTSSQLAPGQSGFHVVVLDSMLNPTAERTFVTNDPTYRSDQVTAMQQFIGDRAGWGLGTPGYLVIVQSIGAPTGFDNKWVNDQFLALHEPGRNFGVQVPREPSTWYAAKSTGNSLAGALGELAGPAAHDRIAQMAAGGAAKPAAPGGFSLVASVGQTMGIYPVDPTSIPQARSAPPESARIVGELTRDAQSLWSVAAPGYQEIFQRGLVPVYQVAYQPPTEWPLSQTAEQRAANRYLTEEVAGFELPDMRLAYYERTSVELNNIVRDLERATYPGAGHGFGAATFNAVRNQLTSELEDVLEVWKLIDNWSKIFTTSSQTSYIDLQALAGKVEEELKIDAEEEHETTSPVWEIIGNALWLVSSLPIETEFPVLDVVGMTAALYDMSYELSQTESGSAPAEPVVAKASRIGARVADNIEAVQENLDRIGAILVSDWGKLQRAAKYARNQWSFNYESPAKDLEGLTLNAKGELARTLISTYNVQYVVNPPWVADTHSRPNPWNIDCNTELDTGHAFGTTDENAASWVTLPAGFDEEGNPIKIWYGLSTPGHIREGVLTRRFHVLPGATSSELFTALRVKSTTLGVDPIDAFADTRFPRYWFWCEPSY